MSPSDYEMIEQGYDPPRMTTLERVEEIVARCETFQYSLPRDEQRALIASWRERGEALKRAQHLIRNLGGQGELLDQIEEALK